MKKIFFVFASALTLSLMACSDSRDGNDKDYGTGEMDPEVTATAPDKSDSSPMINMADTPARPQGQGVPGNDNPRKNDIGGQPHPMDTASGRKAR